jgi:hypothetical protein
MSDGVDDVCAARCPARPLVGSRSGAEDPSPGFHPRPPYTGREVCPPTAFRHPSPHGRHGWTCPPSVGSKRSRRRRHQRQLLIQLHAWWLEGILPIVSHDRPHGQAIVRHDLGFFAGRVLRLPLEISDPTDLLCQFLLDVAVCFTDWLRHIFHIMILANLMRYCGELVVYSSTDRFLRIADYAHNR